MGTTANSGWPYPDPAAPPDAPGQIKALADDIDADYNAPWVAFTPNVYTTMGSTPTAVSRTVGRARYRIVGKTCYAQADVTVNATTTSGCGIDLPVPSKDRVLNAGSAALFGASTPADQSGCAYMGPDKAKLIVVAFSSGFRDATSGQTLRYNVIYEVA